LEQRREISMLKKLDQEENLERTRNFYVLFFPIKVVGHVPEEADREDTDKGDEG
jgi:hypothetical protein